MAIGQSVVLRTITGPMLTDTVLDITRSCDRACARPGPDPRNRSGIPTAAEGPDVPGSPANLRYGNHGAAFQRESGPRSRHRRCHP